MTKIPYPLSLVRYTLYAIFLFLPLLALASGSDGTIDSTNKFAWGDYLGWVNFGTAGGNVHVTKNGLTGYAWSSNYGWINLAPPHAGVTNSCTGQLGGYGWGENTGYVNFSGVSIDSSGRFNGTAVAPAGLGGVSFDCAHCNVQTDWRASVACASGGGGGGGGGGGSGGGGGTGYYNTTTIPTTPTNPTSTPQPPVPQTNYCSEQAKIGDFNCDGKVDFVDLSIFLYYYNQSGSNSSRYDLNHNGTVDFPDVSIIMYHWTG